MGLTVPRTSAWLLAVPDAVEQLQASDRLVFYRSDLERLLGISRPWAATLMRRFGAQVVGSVLVLPRADLIAALRGCRRGRAYTRELARHTRLTGELRRARIASVRVAPAPPAPSALAVLPGLPAGVVLEPGRLEVRFDEPKDAIARLYTLAKVLLAHYDDFETLVTSPSRDIEPAPRADAVG